MQINTERKLPSRAALLTIPLLSGSLFGFEFLLTRILSYLVWYHYVFMIISTAVMGLGFGALWTHSSLKTSSSIHATSLAHRVKMLGVALALVSVLLYLNPFSSMPALYIVVGAIPFVFGGSALSLIFARRSASAGVLYCFDLVGASAAAVGFYVILNRFGMVKSLLALLGVLSVAHMLAVVSEGNGFAKKPSGAARRTGRPVKSLAVTAVILAALALDWSDVEAQFGNPLRGAKLRGYGIRSESATIESTKWDALSRTDVVEFGDPGKKGVFMDAASLSYMYRFDGDLDSVAGLRNELGYLPFLLQESPKTLLIGSGAGRDILMALLAGSTDITAVEINQSAVDAVKEFSEYASDLYSRPEVRSYVGDGRNFVRESDETYDTIYLSLVMTQAAGAQGLSLSENYLFTKEAIREYLGKLTAGGQIAFLAHNEDDMARIVTTALTVLMESGLSYSEAIQRVAIAARSSGATHSGLGLHLPLVIIRRDPIGDTWAKTITEWAAEKGFRPVFVPPFVNDAAFPLGTFGGVDDIISRSRSNIVPVTDDSPFFYNFEKGLPPEFYTVLGLAAVSLLGVFAQTYRGLPSRNKGVARYFFLIGLAYMAVEVVIIQRNTLIVGHPTESFLITIPLLLASSGAGSLLSARMGSDRLANTAMRLLPAGILALAVAYRMVLEPSVMGTTALRLGAVILSVVPVGFAMGIPFPRAMERIRERGDANLVAYAWGLNGIASLIGSSLAMAIGMYWGFTYSLAIGAVAYYLSNKIDT